VNFTLSNIHTIIRGAEESGLLLISNLFNDSFNCAACAGLQSGSGLCEQLIGRDFEASNCGTNEHSFEGPIQIPEPQSGDQPAASFEPWSKGIRMAFGRITAVSTHGVSASEDMKRMGQVHYTALVEWGVGANGHVIYYYKITAFFLVRLRNLPTKFFRRARPKYII
jgi:hypothetical protein